MGVFSAGEGISVMVFIGGGKCGLPGERRLEHNIPRNCEI